MDAIQYIMVTKWQGHWDALRPPIQGARSTFFTHPVIKDPSLIRPPWPAKVRTLFIKLDQNNMYEKSWVGYAENFRPYEYKGGPAVRFDVTGLTVAECPEHYKSYNSGWYISQPGQEISLVSNNLYHPPFFHEMATCNWQPFEDYCYHLLRLLGIHEIHKFPHSDNRGKADGFFTFGKLAIVYDATLETDFDIKKETQINNYINQLKEEKFKTTATNAITIKDLIKRVWIITRASTVREIRSEDMIKVIEIPYTELIDVYDHRIKSQIGTEKLWNILKDLEPES